MKEELRRGPIRFVGGEKHNQVIQVNWGKMNSIVFPPTSRWSTNSTEARPTLQHRTYQLVCMTLKSGAEFYEYHCVAETKEFCEKSGKVDF